MAREVEALVLQVSADVRRMEKALNQVRGTTNRQLGLVEKRFQTMNGRIAGYGKDMSLVLGRSIAAIGLGLAVRETAQYADAWITARNRLAAAGVAASDLADTQARLVSLSLQTRTGITETVDVYARLAQATQGVARSQEDLYRATTIINQAIKAGGAAASEQRSAILQLGQALGSGVLQGDELRSIRENAPLLARAIAAEFGVTTAQLKKLGEEGKLTTDRVFKGILRAGDEIGATFARTEATISDSFTNMGTSITAFVGALDNALGTSRGFQRLLAEIEKAAQGATRALQQEAAKGQGEYLSALAVRVRDGLEETVPALGDYSRSRSGDAQNVLGPLPEALRQAEKWLQDVEKQASKTGFAQKQRATANLRALLDEVTAYKAVVDERQRLNRLELDAIQNNPLVAGQRGGDAIKLRDTIAFDGKEIQSLGVFVEVLTKQLARAQASAPGAFLDDTAAGVDAVGKSFEDANWSKYETDLEKLNTVIREISTAATDMAGALAKAQKAADAALAEDNGTDAAAQRIENTAAALEELKEKASTLNVSRAGVRALLDYASAADDVSQALSQLPRMTAILTADDEALVRSELARMADDAAAIVEVGADRIEREFRDAMQAIADARDAALATGSTDLSRFERAASDALMRRREALDELADEDTSTTTAIQLIQRDFGDTPEPEFEFPEFEAFGEDLRQRMRDSISQGLNDAIRTDDWGQAVRNVFADAITAGMEDALNEVADYLTDILLGSNGSSGVFASIASAFGFGGNRASGGPLSRNTGYRINEVPGRGEFLYTGSNAGQVLTAAQINSKLSGGRGMAPSIDARIIVQGNVTEDVWPRLQAEMARRDQQLLSALPGAIDGRVADSRVRRRF